MRIPMISLVYSKPYGPGCEGDHFWPRNTWISSFSRVFMISCENHVFQQFAMILASFSVKWCLARPSRLDKLLLCQIGSIATIYVQNWYFPPQPPKILHFRLFSWNYPKMLDFRCSGRKIPVSGGTGWECHQFRLDIVTRTAPAARGTTLHPEH